jgi:hypothetical protein
MDIEIAEALCRSVQEIRKKAAQVGISILSGEN